MVDNTELNAGSGGDVIASDDIGGVKHQLVKIEYGDADSATQVSDTNPLPVDDAGGSLTVDNAGTFAVQVDAALPAGTNAIGKLAANTGVDIGDVDVLSVIPGTGATNLGKTEDAAHATGHTGVMPLAVRRNADTTLVDTDGDYAPLQVDAAGKLKVEIFAGGDTHPVSGTVNVTDITTSVTPGTGAANLGKAEDSPHTDASTGVMMLAVSRAADTAMVSADGDYAPLQVDSSGKLKVEIFDGGQSHTVDGTVTANAGTGTFTVDNGGTFAVQVDGAALTALQLIDDSVYADDAAFTLTSSKVTAAGAIVDASLSALAAAEADVVPLRVNANGALHVTGGGGGTEFNEDTAHSTGALGNMPLAVRRDADTTLVDTDNDYAPLQVNAAGALKVEVFDGGDSLTIDNAALAVTGGGVESGALRVTIANDSTGQVTVDGTVTANAGSGNFTVVNGGTFATQVDGDALTALQKIDNIAHSGSDVALVEHVPISGQLDDAATTTVTENQIAPVRITSSRALHTSVQDALPAGDNNIGNVDIVSFPDNEPFNMAQVSGTAISVGTGNSDTGTQRVVLATDQPSLTIDNANIDAVLAQSGGGTEASALRVTIANDSTGLLSVDDGGTALQTQGDATHGAAVAGNPLLGGGEARTTNPTAVDDGDAVRSMHDDLGRQIVTLGHVRDLTTHNRITLTDTTETTLIADPGAGVFADLTHIVLSNESASELRVDIRDSTAGTVRLSVDLAADGGGAVIPYNIPLKQATAANNWTAQLSGSASTVYITAQAILNV